MKRKTYKSIGLVLLIIGLFGLSFVFFRMGLSFLDEPQFTITKEVCSENIISSDNNFICNAGCIYGLADALKITDKNITTSLQRQELLDECSSFCREKAPIITSCHEEEVDSITIFSNKVESEGLREGRIIEFNQNSWTVRKQDLTTIWLDENVECVKFSEGCITSECAREWNQKCSKYKIGNYTIIVK